MENVKNSLFWFACCKQVGSLITRLEATDADTGPNAELQYGIIRGHEDNLFDIDTSTGVIIVGRGLHAERLSSTQQIRLVVVVMDKGIPPLQMIADLFIVVNDTGSLPAETARLGTGETAEASMSSAIIAAVGAAAGGALVVICVVIVAVTVCIMKRKARRRQQTEKQQQSRYC